jgi:transcriptional regulator with PAS, ATPase and Fis domain
VGLSKDLLESELFGHEQGAFTGAHRRKTGKIELAHGGTIFFDEIGDVSQELQAKLLRFLQEREFERLGGVTPISVDVRIIAATNRNLERFVKEGSFRADLFYRLNVVAINLPPLRERREDIAALSQYFLRKHSAAIRTNIREISEEARKKLEAYEWPGNVRELANVIERAVVLGSGPTVKLEDLPGPIASGWATPAREVQSYRQGLDAARRELLLKALATTHGNRSAAAKLLGLEAKYFLKLMKSLRIE